MRHIDPSDAELFEHFDRFAAFCRAGMEQNGSGWRVWLRCDDGTLIETTAERLLDAVAEVLNAAYQAGIDKRAPGEQSRSM